MELQREPARVFEGVVVLDVRTQDLLHREVFDMA